jgi:hypothetical protein
MDPCLRLALLETSYDCELAEEVRDLPYSERKPRYPELMAVDIPADTDEARWTDEAELLEALPDGADETIRSLAGIEAYPQVRLLYLKESAIEDLRPLTALPALELLWVGVTDEAHLTPLLSCERLRRVHLEWPVLANEPGRVVLETLAARGVQVDYLLPDPDDTVAPFTDPNLKLAVLDELQGTIGLPKMYFFDEYAFDEDNLARMMAVGLSAEQLDGIEALAWRGGGHTAAHLVWGQWDGESDEFDITSLAGIEALHNLKELLVSPLGLLPAEQVAALRARGVTVGEY